MTISVLSSFDTVSALICQQLSMFLKCRLIGSPLEEEAQIKRKYSLISWLQIFHFVRIVKHRVISSTRGLAQYRTASHIEKFDNIEHLNDEFI